MEFPRLDMIVHHQDAAREAGVTQEQIDALSQMAYENRRNLIKIRANLELANVELQYLMDQAKPDQEKIEKAIDEAGKIRTQLEKIRVLEGLKVKEILGDGTVVKIKDWMREHGNKPPMRNEAKDREDPED